MEVFSLPTNIICEVLSSWIEVVSLVRLDTEVRHSKAWSVFREATSSTEFVLNSELNFSNYFALKWLTEQSVRVEAFELDEETDEYHLTQYLSQHGPHVRKAMFYICARVICARVICDRY